MAIESGAKLGNYEIRSLLGSGGMGEVYLASDLKLHRLVAIKVIRTDLTVDEARVGRFEREALTASSLNHPNILTIYELGREGEYHFIVTEYVDGESLTKHIRPERVQLQEVLDIGIQVCSALAAAHAAGVVHRDIKPDNIMLRRDWLVKVVDFGLAKLSEHDTAELETKLYTTAPGLVLGTAPYMSPEQARGLPLDARTDIWSLGVVLYQLVCGCLPFAGATMSDIIAAILMKEPTDLTKYKPGVPAEIERIVGKALRKDLTERYQSAGDLGRDLKSLKQQLEFEAEAQLAHDKSGRPTTELLNNETGQAYKTDAISAPALTAEEHVETPTIAELNPRQARRRRRRLAVITAAATVLLVGAGFLIYLLMRQLQLRRGSSESSESAVEVAPFTSFPGDERLPSFSPDGNRIAFSWDGDQGDNTDIYVKQIGTETLQRLTTDPAPDIQPRWSPDGLDIAFLRQKSGAFELYVMPSIGGPERKVTEISLVEPGRFDTVQMSWSPDGKWLAVSDKSSAEAPYSIFMVGRDSGEKRQLTSPISGSTGDLSPAVSPDGKNVAYRHSEIGGVSEIYVTPTTGGQPRRLTFSEDIKVAPAWTPDGREILFLSETGSYVSTLWRIPAAGGTPERVEATGQGLTSFAISPKGNRLAWAQAISDSNIWQVELSGTALPVANRQSAKMLISSTRADTSPQFSPDGKRIVFASNRSGASGIWVADSDGRNPMMLTSFDQGRTGSPRWSPDGLWIVFDGRVERDVDIYVISAQGGRLRRLTTEPSEEFVPSFSRDGKWVYFCSNRSAPIQIWKMPADGGNEVQVTRGGGFDNTESPDGKYLYYGKQRGKPGIWRVPVAGGEEELVVDHHRAGFWRQWAVSEHGIFFATEETSGHAVIEFYSFATGKVSLIMSLEKGLPDTISGLCVSPDGRRLVWTQLDQISSDITLMNHFH
jgi:Tol biopolymer transport system component/serine/threonine protein kinase